MNFHVGRLCVATHSRPAMSPAGSLASPAAACITPFFIYGNVRERVSGSAVQAICQLTGKSPRRSAELAQG